MHSKVILSVIKVYDCGLTGVIANEVLHLGDPLRDHNYFAFPCLFREFDIYFVNIASHVQMAPWRNG